MILQQQQIIVELLSSELKKSLMNYSKEGPRVFMPYDETTIENIKEACKTFFRKHRPCDILASEMGPSCTKVDQIQNIIYSIYWF